MNNYDVNGRNLRVDFAEQDKEDFGNNAGGSGGGNGGNAGPARSSRAREESAVLEVDNKIGLCTTYFYYRYDHRDS